MLFHANHPCGLQLTLRSRHCIPWTPVEPCVGPLDFNVWPTTHLKHAETHLNYISIISPLHLSIELYLHDDWFLLRLCFNCSEKKKHQCSTRMNSRFLHINYNMLNRIKHLWKNAPGSIAVNTLNLWPRLIGGCNPPWTIRWSFGIVISFPGFFSSKKFDTNLSGEHRSVVWAGFFCMYKLVPQLCLLVYKPTNYRNIHIL